jgi:hypothetical protein
MAAVALPPDFLARWAGGGAPAAHVQPEALAAPAEAAAGAAYALAALALSAPPGDAQPDGSAPAPRAGGAPGADDASLMHDAAARGVSLAFLRDFYACCVAPLEAGGEPLSTSDVNQRLVEPATAHAPAGHFALLVPGAVGPPSAFVEHSYANPFALVVAALEEHFVDAVPEAVYVWVDIFAVGLSVSLVTVLDTLRALTGEQTENTMVVVLDRNALPLRRPWCLKEIAFTPPSKLRTIMPGFRAAELVAAVRAAVVDDDSSESRVTFSPPASLGDTRSLTIRQLAIEPITVHQLVRLQLLLSPTSYERHITSILDTLPAGEHATPRFEELCRFLTHDGGGGGGAEPRASRLALIAGGLGEGKSAVAAALWRAPHAVHAHHFENALGDPRSAQLAVVLRALAFQLACRFPAARAVAEAQPDGVLAAALSGDAAAAWRVLRAQLRAVAGERVVFLFDAIDEAPEAAPAEGGDDEDNDVPAPRSVLELVCALGRLEGGAAALSVVVTTRPEEARVLAPLRAAWSGGAARVHRFAPAHLRRPEPGAAAPLQASDAAVQAIAACGVSLAFLADFAARHVASLGDAATTRDVVQRVIKPATAGAGPGGGTMRYTDLLPPSAVGAPAAFVSHAFDNRFGLLTAALAAHFAGADPATVFVWLDIFAINQHDPGADLHGGDVLSLALGGARATCAVLDRRGHTLSRLWCLYEIGCTPPGQLALLATDCGRDDLAAAAAAISAQAAQCGDPRDTPRIHERIRRRHRSLAAFSDMLRLRLFSMLPPPAGEAEGEEDAPRRLLAALVAAPAPPSAKALHAMRLYAARTRLPGWGHLFAERDGRLHSLHKGLQDWLSAEARQELLHAGRALWEEHAARVAEAAADGGSTCSWMTRGAEPGRP